MCQKNYLFVYKLSVKYNKLLKEEAIHIGCCFYYINWENYMLNQNTRKVFVYRQTPEFLVMTGLCFTLNTKNVTINQVVARSPIFLPSLSLTVEFIVCVQKHSHSQLSVVSTYI